MKNRYTTWKHKGFQYMKESLSVHVTVKVALQKEAILSSLWKKEKYLSYDSNLTGVLP